MVGIFLMRHGIAADLGVGGVIRDADRPLTPEGRAKLQVMAEGMRRLELKFNLIFTSPLLRARQTAEVVADVLELQHKVKLLESLAPGKGLVGAESGKAEIFIEMGAYSFTRALLVGHQPDSKSQCGVQEGEHLRNRDDKHSTTRPGLVALARSAASIA